MLDQEEGARIAARLARARAVAARLEADLLEADAGDPRLAPAVAAARRVVQRGAARWWTIPARGLGWRIPRDVALASEEGCTEVVDLLSRVEHGILA